VPSPDVRQQAETSCCRVFLAVTTRIAVYFEYFEYS
jgi:hypothetical protein